MLPDRVSNPGPLTYESGALPIALRGPVAGYQNVCYIPRIDLIEVINKFSCSSQLSMELFLLINV